MVANLSTALRGIYSCIIEVIIIKSEFSKVNVDKLTYSYLMDKKPGYLTNISLVYRFSFS